MHGHFWVVLTCNFLKLLKQTWVSPASALLFVQIIPTEFHAGEGRFPFFISLSYASL